MLQRFLTILTTLTIILFISSCENTAKVLLPVIDATPEVTQPTEPSTPTTETETPEQTTETPSTDPAETDDEPENEPELPTIEFNPETTVRPEPSTPANYEPQDGDVVRERDELASHIPFFQDAAEALQSDFVKDSFARLETILEKYCAGELTERDITRGEEYSNSGFAIYLSSREERDKFHDALPETETLTYYPIVVDFVENVAYYICAVRITNPAAACPAE